MREWMFTLLEGSLVGASGDDMECALLTLSSLAL